MLYEMIWKKNVTDLMVTAVLLSLLWACSQVNSASGTTQNTTPDSSKFQIPTYSQFASVQQTIGVSNVVISYYRPNVKGRNIWGNVVKYDTVWVAGAEFATSFHFDDTVWVNGNILPSGNYAFFIIPRKEGPWTAIFNNRPGQYGTSQYRTSDNVLSFNVVPTSSPFTESLTFDISNISADTGWVAMKWENKEIKFPVSFPSKQLAWNKIESYLATSSTLPDSVRFSNDIQIANYCLFAKDTAHVNRALSIIDSGLAIKPNDYNFLMVKSGLFDLKGDYKQAMKLAIQSIKLGSGNGMREEIANELDSNIRRYKTLIATNVNKK